MSYPYTSAKPGMFAPLRVILLGLVEGLIRMGPAQRIADATTMELEPSPHDITKLGLSRQV